MNINLKTRLTGLFGYPLSHSFAYQMHNENFKALDVNSVFLPFEVEKSALKSAFESTKSLGFMGFAVTKPYKVDALAYMDELDQTAKQIGSVNCVKVKDGKLIGYNTDGVGMVHSMIYDNDVEVEGKKVIMLGAGGASRAVLYTLCNYGVNEVVIFNRNFDKSVKLADEMKKEGFNASAFEMNEAHLAREIKSADILVNGTGVGMYPNVEDTPLDKKYLHKDLVVCDFVYNPILTKILVDAKEIGCKVVNGEGMLIRQGAIACKIWTDKEADIDKMKNIVKNIMKSEM